MGSGISGAGRGSPSSPEVDDVQQQGEIEETPPQEQTGSAGNPAASNYAGRQLNNAARAQRRGEVGQGAMLQQMELQRLFAAQSSSTPQNRRETTYPSAFAPSMGGVQQARETLRSGFAEVQEFGRSLAEGKGPATAEEKQAWEAAQVKLREKVTQLAAKITQLPENSPEREAARAELEQMSKQMANMELPILARTDPEFGKSWNEQHSKVPGSEGAVLPTRMKMYGITDEQMNEYITTGKESPGLTKAFAEARKTGEWPALGVLRGAYQQRADYLRATTPKEDTASRKHAANLDAAAATLTHNRGNIHLNWASNTYSTLAAKYPDESKRPDSVKTQLKEAKEAIVSVSKQAAENVEKHPERYGKDSPTRKLAGDAMATEANIMDTEARTQMQAQAKKQEPPKDPKIVPAPSSLHPDLVEGGAVDKKRQAAVKIDPSLGDIVNGGDRAVKFARDSMQTKQLRLTVDEQQLAHVVSKKQDPPPELAVKVNKQLDKLFTATLDTNQKLAKQKPGSLSLAQTQLLAQTGADANVLSRKLSVVGREKDQIKSAYRLNNSNEAQVHNARIALEEKYKAFEQEKINRVKKDLGPQRAFESINFEEILKFEKNPAEYARNAPDTKEEAELRGIFNEASEEIKEQISEAHQRSVDSKKALDLSDKIDYAGGLTTTQEMAASQAAEALKRSEAHLKAIPDKGPERLPRMQLLMEHQSAVIGVNTTIRHNADSKMERTNLEHQQTLQVYAGYTHPNGESPIEVSKGNLAKVMADEMLAKRGAFAAATVASDESDRIRKSINKELDLELSKLPKHIQQQRAAGVQSYKDSLAVQQVRVQGAVAELGADLNPPQALAELDKGTSIVNKELPLAQVSRTDKKQAITDHARNELRADALANLGESSYAIARRAQTRGGIEYGGLIVDSLNRAGSHASEVHRALAVDGAGAVEATASKEFHKEMKDRADAIAKGVTEMNKTADVGALADKIEKEVAKDLEDFNDRYTKLSKAVKDQRGGAFGILFSAGARLRGININKEGVEAGQVGLDFAASNARAQATVLKRGAEQLREMKRQNIPDHVIMSALRDPRLGINVADGQQKFLREVGAWRDEFNASMKHIGTKFQVDAVPFNVMRAETPLGKVLETATSNRTDRIVDFIGNRNTDLLSKNQGELQGFFNAGQQQWRDAAPYVMLSNAPDQVMLAVGSSYAMAGVFARAASFTRIPQAFNAMRGVAAGMSVPARLAVLGGVNLAEAGLGIATGELVSKTGTAVFGKDSFGAKAFEVIGGGLQLSAGSAVALRSGLGFQAAMGFAMQGVPIVAQQLGASPELAAKIGMATGAFVPAVMGTMGNLKTLKSAERIMVNEYGIDPKKAKGLMGEVFAAEAHGGTAFDVDHFTRERALKLVEKRFQDLPPEARSNLADNLTLDSVRKTIPFDPPKSGTPDQFFREVENHFSQVETAMIQKGVAKDRARELAQDAKTAMFEESLAKTHRAIAGDERTGSVPDNGFSTARNAMEQAARSAGGTLPEVQVLRTVRAQGAAAGQAAESGYRLVNMDRSKNSAWVVDSQGAVKEVPASNIIYVHQNQPPYGLMPPALRERFEHRLAGLNEAERKQWDTMITQARESSPEHVQALRQMLSGSEDFKQVRDWHKQAQNMSQEQLGQYANPGLLHQHLKEACAAACAQKIEAMLNPQRAAELKNPDIQVFGQINRMSNNGGGSTPRTDRNYPLAGQHLGNDFFVPARTVDPVHHPDLLRSALESKGKTDHEVYSIGDLDRRAVPEHLEQLAARNGGIVFTGLESNGTAYEILKGVKTTPEGNEISIRKVGDSNEGVPVKVKDLLSQNGSVRFPNEKPITYIAAPPDFPLKAAKNGLILENDPQIRESIRAATGRDIVSHSSTGQEALRAIEDSVKHVGFAGVAVRWRDKGQPESTAHQLVITGVKKENGQTMFDVFDPWFGKSKTLSGKDLLEYKEFGTVGEVFKVQTLDNQQVAMIPSAKPGDTARMNYASDAGNSRDHALASLETIKTPTAMEIDSVLAMSVRGFGSAETQTRENLINMIMNNSDPVARRAILDLAPLITGAPPSVSHLIQTQLAGRNAQDLARIAERLGREKQPDWNRVQEEEAFQFARRILGQ